ncbi:modifier of mdg4 isoform X4 [Stomoxys calcitrans]|uniref:modifier of mdg4 isoform X4 n=1 Tax=Stomoxys calcitrans TaxID=35570 RepID=UPI0027E28463|nr:modifier of mdg4 isoform X4 [Stomoxys calcitrans]
MADDEQFSLCWNNFNSNLSAGFHESLCRGDLVDVTLAAEGQFVKAHRLVLSVCSPYFRKMFTQMPANQHAFVFLKDVSHTALKDLIQFMYCGEVNVKQEALPAFISTAEALQIKGLTDSDPPQSQTPPEPSTPTPQIQSQQIQASPRVRHRTSTGRSYKIETVDDSGDDTKQTTQIVIQTTAPSHPPQATITTQAPQQQHHHHHHHQQQQQHQPPQQHIAQQPIQTQTHQLAGVSLPTSTATTAVVTHKRPAQRTNLGSVPHIKRSKSTIDPLEASDATVATQQLNVQTTVVTSDVTKSQSQQHHHHQQQQQTQSHHHQSQPQQTNEPEYIDMPMELPTKSEPDYVEDAGEVDQGEQDGTYVEDESYGDMRYDESYFTEGEEAGGAAGNAATGGATSTSATATTSKAIVKSQPLSDSAYMDSTGDQANSDAQVVLANEVVPNPEDVLVFFTQSLRGRPAIMANGVRFLIMSENKKKILWRCSSMATKKIKCPARITMLKETPPKFIINKAEHVHAELKRNKYGSTKHQVLTVAATKLKSDSIEYDGTINYQVISAAAPAEDQQEEPAPQQPQHHSHHQHHQHHQQQQEQQ